MDELTPERRENLENSELRHQSLTYLANNILLGIQNEKALKEQLSKKRQELDKSLQQIKELQQQQEIERKAKAELQAKSDHQCVQLRDQNDKLVELNKSRTQDSKKILQLGEKIEKATVDMGGDLLPHQELDPVAQLEKQFNLFCQQLVVNDSWEENVVLVARMQKAIPYLERNTRGNSPVSNEDEVQDPNVSEPSSEMMKSKGEPPKKRLRLTSGKGGLANSTLATHRSLDEHLAKEMDVNVDNKILEIPRRNGGSRPFPKQLSSPVKDKNRTAEL